LRRMENNMKIFENIKEFFFSADEDYADQGDMPIRQDKSAASADAVNFHTLAQSSSNNSSDCSVHTRSVAAAC